MATILEEIGKMLGEADKRNREARKEAISKVREAHKEFPSQAIKDFLKGKTEIVEF